MLKIADVNDIEEIVRIHRAALPGDLLPKLGRRFLTRQFYPCILESDDALVLADEEGGRLTAFIVFTLGAPSLVDEALGGRIRLAGVVLLAALRHPSIIREVLAHARGIRPAFDGGTTIDTGGLPEIFVLATSPDCQSQGIGGALLDAGLEKIRERDSRCVVKTSSDGARRFYGRHGFEVIGSETRGRRNISILLRSPAD